MLIVLRLVFLLLQKMKRLSPFFSLLLALLLVLLRAQRFLIENLFCGDELTPRHIIWIFHVRAKWVFDDTFNTAWICVATVTQRDADNTWWKSLISGHFEFTAFVLQVIGSQGGAMMSWSTWSNFWRFLHTRARPAFLTTSSKTVTHRRHTTIFLDV